MKFNIGSIKSCVTEDIFNKGLQIYLQKQIKVTDLVVNNVGGEFKFTFPIPSIDSTSIYNTSIKLIKKEVDYFFDGCLCKCFYCSHNKAICEHIVALCFIIMDYLKYGNNEIDVYCNLFYKKQKEERLLKLFSNNLISNVKLIPYFIIEDEKIFLKLGIKETKEYVISNIYNFLEAIHYGYDIKYGKSLGFMHHISCFSLTSQKLIELLFVSKVSNVNKMIEINSYLLDKILDIYQNKVINFSVNNNSYKIFNYLEELNMNILVDYKDVKCILPKHIYLLKCFNKLILFSKDKTSIILLSNSEMNFVSSLIENNYCINISDSKEFFFGKIFPKIKRITELADEIKEEFPIYPLEINSYFDFNNSKIEIKHEIIENEKIVLKDKLAVLSKVTFFEYEELLLKLNFNINTNTISDISYITDFLHADLSEFKKFGNVFLSEKLKKINIKKPSKFSLGINYNVNLLELNIDSVMSNEELELILNAYTNKQKYVILNSDTIFEIDDEVKELARYVEEYELEVTDLKTPKIKPSYTILNLLKEDNAKSNDTKNILEDFSNYKNKDIYPIKNINKVLRPYQLEAFRWLSTISEYGFGGLLADDMGLGKTLEILSLILSDESNKPSIIVSPMSLVYNWSNEIAKWGSDIEVHILIGSIKDRIKIMSNINYNKKAIYLVSYDILKKDVSNLNGLFRFVVIDEAQYIKNRNTKTAISVKQLNSEVRYALTGTPIENSLSDLWSIFDFILPNYLSSYNRFKGDFEVYNDVTDESFELLQKKVSPFILRRTKKDVLKDLPDKLEEVYYATLSDSQKELYDAYLNKARNSLGSGNEIEILSIITRLRQICVSPKMFLSDYKHEEVKIDLAIDLITKALNGNHKILLFSQFTSAFNMLSSRLKDLGINYYVLTGKTTAKERVTLSNDFNTKDDVNLFLISLKAGGTGLNLHGADTVIHLDPWWNSSAEAQATDRAHRIGQKKVLNVIKLICANTIEEKVLKLQSYKAELSSKVIDENQNKEKKLNIKDLEFLLYDE